MILDSLMKDVTPSPVIVDMDKQAKAMGGKGGPVRLKVADYVQLLIPS